MVLNLQVYKAKTRDGKNVAVKVQYIDLQDRFVGDITTLKILITIAGWLHRDFDFAWVLDVSIWFLGATMDYLLVTAAVDES